MDVSAILKNFSVVALDGHDGTGKTTLSRRLATALSAEYIKPFTGNAGEIMLLSAENGEFDFAKTLAEKLICNAFINVQNTRVVMDRSYLTVLSLLPESTRPAWLFRPHTILCHAEYKSIEERLSSRAFEALYPRDYHVKYLSLYQYLAGMFDVPVLRTDMLSEDECLKKLLVLCEEIFV